MLQAIARPPYTSFAGSAFKSNGIYGIAPGLINAPFARALGLALGEMAIERGISAVVVGRDCRINGVELIAALQAGLRATGINVIDIGMTTTPLAYFAAHECGSGAAVIVTGGHLPSGYNGFNIMLDGRELHGTALQSLRERMDEGAAAQAVEPGARSQVSLQADYIKRIATDIRLARPMHIAVDCGNGMAGPVLPALLRELGCTVTELFCEPNGEFPNHLPDPGDRQNLQDLIYCLRYSECELGIALDGDGDRLAVVTKAGAIIGSDQLMMVFGHDLLARQPGVRIVHDVQSSRHLQRTIASAGGHTTMWRTCRASIRARMDEEGALLGGDTSGHLMFQDRWYGFSDGAYAAARLLELLSQDPRDAMSRLDSLPFVCTTPELRALTGAADPQRLVDTLCHTAQFAGSDDFIQIDGLRVEYADGFGLVRASTSTSALVFRFEADNLHALTRIQAEFRKQLRRVAPRLQLPF